MSDSRRVVKLLQQATAALAPAYAELAGQLPAELVLGIDESPTKEARLKSWPWVFVASSFTVFALRTTRAATVLHELLTEVEPTNNVSERALRPAVIWRKLSFGTQSAGGSRFVETILTVVETCHKQSRNSFEYLTTAVEAHFADQPAPSLLSGV